MHVVIVDVAWLRRRMRDRAMVRPAVHGRRLCPRRGCSAAIWFLIADARVFTRTAGLIAVVRTHKTRRLMKMCRTKTEFTVSYETNLNLARCGGCIAWNFVQRTMRCAFLPDWNASAVADGNALPETACPAATGRARNERRPMAPMRRSRQRPMHRRRIGRRAPVRAAGTGSARCSCRCPSRTSPAARNSRRCRCS